MSDGTDGKSLLIGILVGTAVGLAVGYLTAPQSGKETREKLREKVEEIKGKAESTISKVKDVASARFGAGKEA